MKIRLRKIGDQYGILLSTKAIKRLSLAEGDVLTISATENGFHLSVLDEGVSEQIKAFRRTEAKHRNTYRRLSE